MTISSCSAYIVSNYNNKDIGLKCIFVLSKVDVVTNHVGLLSQFIYLGAQFV